MQAKTKKWLYWSAGILLGVFILLATCITLTPTVIKQLYVGWLEQQGLAGAIREIDFQLGTGRILIYDVSITKQGKQQLLLDKIVLQIRPSDILDNTIMVDTLEISGARISLRQADSKLSVAGLTLNTATRNNTQAAENNASPWNLKINNIILKDINTCLQRSASQTVAALHICQTVESMKWSGHTRYEVTSMNQPALIANGNFSLKKLTLTDESVGQQIIKIGNLEVSDIAVNSLDDITIKNIALSDYAALEQASEAGKKKYALRLKNLKIGNTVLLQQTRLSIDDVTLAELSGNIVVTKNKTLAALDYINSIIPTEQPDTKGPAVDQAHKKNVVPFLFNIKNIQLTSKHDINVQDNSVKPATSHKFSNLNINIKDIHNTDKDSYSPLEIEIGISKYGTMKLAGKIQLFTTKPSYILDGKITALNLAEYSAYSNQLLQHDVKSGQLDADLNIKINKGQIDSRAVLYLHKFYVDKPEQKEESAYQKSLGMPLATALSLLRSKDDLIKVELPVSGDLENPDFSLNDILNTVSAKALKTAILNYYTSLGLVTFVGKAVNLATALRFDPVIFDAAGIKLDDDAVSQLDKLAHLLIERPTIHLVICGHVTRDDRFRLFPMDQEWFLEHQEKSRATDDEESKDLASSPSLPALSEKNLEKLIFLARQRAENVKEYLVKTKGTGANRLILCNPVYDPADDQPPYVEITI